MQDKVVRIPFNRQAYLNNQQVIWDLMYKEVSPSYIIYIVVTAVVLITGLIIDLKGGLPLTTIIGICMLISISLRFRQVRKVHRNVFNRAETQADRMEAGSGIYTYTFNQQGIIYQDDETIMTHTWDDFEPLKVHKLYHLLLYLKEKEAVQYVISQEEVGEDVYNGIYMLLLEKLSPVS
ncbi:hypothetical protein HQ865_13840 [Mucilaginibacter mali]|uniref:YcxB-like protein domain-containing protein n=1 Tax=Mucilaginibacter mali TaxID=2740462 RepID=A0A7D4QBV6_9SPHI|nr:hypothetical protein [Mucilaginibacter mali]QKJ30784.1 hypothetical protein HQ865_13840 [Mucilaginibacter mali]